MKHRTPRLAHKVGPALARGKTRASGTRSPTLVRSLSKSHSRVICAVWNEMDDPGDGSLHREYNWTLLKYVGDDKWSYEEDIYSTVEFGKMIGKWAKAKGANAKG